MSKMSEESSLYRLFLRLFLKSVVDSSVWVSAAIASLTFFVQHALALTPDWRPAALIFCAALIPYNLDRILDAVVQENPDSQTQIFSQTSAVWLVLLGAAVGTGTLIYQAPPPARWVSLGGLVPLIYGLPLFPWRRDADPIRWYRIKDIPGIKAWIVCSSITYAVVALPLGYAMQPLSLSAIVTALWLLVFVGSNSHMFDARDIASDQQQGVATLPVLVGIRETRVILTGLNSLTFLMLIWGYAQGLRVPEVAIALPATLLALLYIWMLTPKTPRQIYNIWIDGILFLPALITCILL